MCSASAQLAQNAGARVRTALRRPKPPRTRGRVHTSWMAGATRLDGTSKNLQTHRHSPACNAANCCELSGRTTRRKYVARAAAQCNKSAQLDCRSSRAGILSNKVCMVCDDAKQLIRYEFVMSKRSAQHFDSSGLGRQLFVSIPHNSLRDRRPMASAPTRHMIRDALLRGSRLASFHNECGYVNGFWRILYTGPTRSGLVTVQMSSKNASRRSSGSNCRCTASRA